MFQDTLNYLLEYVRGISSEYGEWYSGVTDNAETRLFQEHGVDRLNGAWAYKGCVNSLTARQVEQYLFNLGMRGGAGGGDNQSSIVYVYRITNQTRQ